MTKQATWRSSLFFAFVGAILATLIDLLIRGSLPKQASDYLPIITSIIVGAILGWVFDLARGLQSILNDALLRLETLSRALEYQQNALETLIKDRKHIKVLSTMIKESVQDKFLHIPYVDRNTYHMYLGMAIEQSDRFEGVQNKPLRWYYDKNEGGYLRKIRIRNIPVKRRIFIILDEDKQDMERDLKDYEVMKYYWSNTGTDLDSYWITRADFVRNFPNLETVVGDFGLYDNQLLIKYDVQHLVVTFELIDEGAKEQRLFAVLDNQVQQGFSEPFIAIDPKDLETLQAQRSANSAQDQLR